MNLKEGEDVPEPNQVVPEAEKFAPAAQVIAGGVAACTPLQVAAVKLENNCEHSCPEPECGCIG